MKKIILVGLILTFLVAFNMGKAEALGPWHLQLNEFVDCYVVYIDLPDFATYGTIPYYPGTFGGLFDTEGRIAVGWVYSGTPLVTIFRIDGTESLCYNYGNSLSCFSNATWSMASSCSLSEGGPSQLGE